MRKSIGLVIIAGLALSACGGRDPQQIQVVQAYDHTSDCTAISAEINANQVRITSLRKESSDTTGKNVALGVAGAILFWPALFAMDFKDGAGKDAASLEARNNYLAQVMAQRCGHVG
jgi:hypothetical protein